MTRHGYEDDKPCGTAAFDGTIGASETPPRKHYVGNTESNGRGRQILDVLD